MLQAVLTDPGVQGHPCRRPRKYCILTLRTAITAPSWTSKDYQRIAADAPFGDASLYFTADQSACEQYKKILAQKRHIPLTVHGLSTPWEQVMSCSLTKRLGRYDTFGVEGSRKGRFVVADLMQEPSFIGGPSCHVPALLRNSYLYGWWSRECAGEPTGRPLLPSEYLLVQALPVHVPDCVGFKHMSRAFKNPVALAQMGPACLKQLAGNGMNAAQAGVPLLFATCGSAWELPDHMTT